VKAWVLLPNHDTCVLEISERPPELLIVYPDRGAQRWDRQRWRAVDPDSREAQHGIRLRARVIEGRLWYQQ